MPQLSENSILYAPKDWWQGWGVLRRNRQATIAALQQDLQKAEIFSNEEVIDKDLDGITHNQILKPGLHATAGVLLPIAGTDIGAMVGTFSGAFADFGVYEKIIHFPIPVGIAVIATSGAVGAAVGLLESLALTPQARAGREERLRRLYTQE